MKPVILLAFYLGDQMVSGALPFSSGPFSIAAVLICWRRSVVSARMRQQALLVAALLLMCGCAGAPLSASPMSTFFIATTMMVTLMWVIGAGLQQRHSVLITPYMAFAGVLFATFFLLLSALGWDAMTVVLRIPTNRGAGLFIEPSHYALFVMPLWMIAYQKRRYRPALYVALVLTFLTCFSATLIAFLLISMGLSLFLSTAAQDYRPLKLIRQIAITAVVLVAAYFATASVDVEGITLHAYVQNRVNGLVNAGEPGSTNLSSLVVLQGVELAQISLAESRGLGVGLGNFGLSERVINQSDVRTLINAVTADAIDLNLRDGGLLANKLVGELGLLSLVLAFALIRYLRLLRAEQSPKMRHYHAAFAAALLTLLFVRVLPYFAAPTCLAIFSFAGVLHQSKSRRLHRAPQGRAGATPKVPVVANATDHP